MAFVCWRITRKHYQVMAARVATSGNTGLEGLTMHLSNKLVSLSVAGAIALAFLAAIPSAVSEISAVEQRQASANIALQEWKAAYQALLPVNAVWKETFTDVARTRDLVELYRAF